MCADKFQTFIWIENDLLLISEQDTRSKSSQLKNQGGFKTPAAQETVENLKKKEDMLGKKLDYLEKKVDKELKVAKENAATNKRGNCCK